MRYHGFATIDYLILKQVQFGSDKSVLEIGVGTGSTAGKIIGKVKEYCGIDISAKTINQLTSLYIKDTNIRFHTVDVCKDVNLGKRFDIVFSADTLEHVESPAGFFNFIARHLSFDGTAIITFPNESEKRHHGITWFDRKKDIEQLTENANLEIVELFQVKKACLHRLFENLLWNLPKSLVSKRSNVLPQSFEDTQAFTIIETGGLKTIILALYAKAVTKFTALFPLYNIVKIVDGISNKVLLIHLKHKGLEV